MDPELIELLPGPFEPLFALAVERGLSLSMIRHERRLASAGDARALALDPLAPPALTAQLGWLRPGATHGGTGAPGGKACARGPHRVQPGHE